MADDIDGWIGVKRAEYEKILGCFQDDGMNNNRGYLLYRSRAKSLQMQYFIQIQVYYTHKKKVVKGVKIK